jgi:hypothetical protein
MAGLTIFRIGRCFKEVDRQAEIKELHISGAVAQAGSNQVFSIGICKM